MKAVKAVYENGQVQLSEPIANSDPGPIDVLVVFPEAADDPWRDILSETTSRHAFPKFAEGALEEIAQRKTEPLELDRL